MLARKCWMLTEPSRATNGRPYIQDRQLIRQSHP